MKFREALQTIDGLRTVYSEMELLSGIGRTMLQEADFMTGREEMEKVFGNIGTAVEFLNERLNADKINAINSLLNDVNDISGTIRRLEKGDVPGEIELFEIKNTAITAERLAAIYKGTKLETIDAVAIPDLRPVIEILDPEKTGNSHFHIYDAYSAELAGKRKELRKLQSFPNYDETESSRLLGECMVIEDRVKEKLGESLHPYAGELRRALEAIGNSDIIFAKARLAEAHQLVRPTVSNAETQYSGLRYLPVELLLRRQGKEFQPVDITLCSGVTMITGANMGGKTVTLKSVALAQTMAQFGFYVPAESASVRPVEGVLQSIGDSQSETEGLSSFGAEILRLDEILKKAEGGGTYLILIDEPARTTNPEEGTAIAGALIEMLDKTQSITLLTTHYGNIPIECRRLRVKGIKEVKGSDGNVSLHSLSRMMDYTIVEVEEKDIDREALAIARLLGIDERFANNIENYIKADL